MKCFKILMTLALTTAMLSTASAQNKKAFLNAKEAGADFQIQGEYSGMVGDAKVGIQVIAQGDGKFNSVGYIGGLPGDGWDGTEKIKGSGSVEDGVCILKPEKQDQNAHGEIKDGVLKLFRDGTEVAALKKVVRKSPTLGKKAPEGAVVLFDGSSADNFKNGRLDGKLLMEGTTSKQTFQRFNIHIEFQLSFMPWARGQGRSNSGYYNQGRYEVQILDSFGLEGKHNECGGIYSIEDPKVNMCFPPLSWQTYDIEYHTAKYDDAGRKTEHAWMTVKHNGVVVHEKTKLDHATTASPLREGPEPGPVFFQNHGNPVRFRNIWLVPIED